MLCLEIHLNGERYCVAGVPAGVVSTFVSHVDIPPGPDMPSAPSTSLTVNGFHFHGPDPGDQTAVHWRDMTRMLRPGDEVRIRLVDTDESGAIDEPDAYTVTAMLPDIAEDDT